MRFPPSRESFFSFFKFCYYQFLPSPTLSCYYHMMMVNSRSSSWDCFVTGPFNWGTVCRINIYIVIHYVRLPDIGNVQKILFSYFHSLYLSFHIAFTMLLLKYCFLITHKMGKSKCLGTGIAQRLTRFIRSYSIPHKIWWGLRPDHCFFGLERNSWGWAIWGAYKATTLPYHTYTW